MSLNEELFDLLDAGIEELADLEKFEPVPAGNHLFQLKWERKEINSFPAVVASFTLKETLEMLNPSEPVPEPGKKADIAFILKRKDKNTGEVVPNTVGQGQLKEVLRVLRESFGGDTPNEIMTNSEGCDVAVVMKIRVNKDDPDVKYNTIKALVVA